MSTAEMAYEKRKARLAAEKEIEEYEKTTVEYRRGLTHDEKARMFKLTYREPWPFEEGKVERDSPYVECDVCGAYRDNELDDFSGHIFMGKEGIDMWFCYECWQDYYAAHDDNWEPNEGDDDPDLLFALSDWRQLGSESESESDDD